MRWQKPDSPAVDADSVDIRRARAVVIDSEHTLLISCVMNPSLAGVPSPQTGG